MTRLLRLLSLAVLVVVAVTLQVTVFSHFSLTGVVPDLVLLIVLGAALVRGPDYAAAVGFGAGLLLDLAPPADHTAGRWALSLVIVGYLTGLAKPDGDVSKLGTLLMAAAGAFVGTSLFALTGLVLGDPGVTVAAAFEVVPRAVLYDVIVTPLVVPLVVVLLRRLEPAERW
ncbi:MAG: rod shape-determining protein MreD [Propionibacteriales bacterium]|nr:rod shape-determining protein MreD [Propionibacteriales bacterium]